MKCLQCRALKREMRKFAPKVRKKLGLPDCLVSFEQITLYRRTPFDEPGYVHRVDAEGMRNAPMRYCPACGREIRKMMRKWERKRQMQADRKARMFAHSEGGHGQDA